jgi:hypothetical protein
MNFVPVVILMVCCAAVLGEQCRYASKFDSDAIHCGGGVYVGGSSEDGP